MIEEINSDSYAKAIVGMMADYEITMFDALLWDFESYCGLTDAANIYHVDGLQSLERRFRVYLVRHGVEDIKDEDFYTDLFMGRTHNIGLRRVKEEK